MFKLRQSLKFKLKTSALLAEWWCKLTVDYLYTVWWIIYAIYDSKLDLPKIAENNWKEHLVYETYLLKFHKNIHPLTRLLVDPETQLLSDDCEAKLVNICVCHKNWHSGSLFFSFKKTKCARPFNYSLLDTDQCLSAVINAIMTVNHTLHHPWREICCWDTEQNQLKEDNRSSPIDGFDLIWTPRFDTLKRICNCGPAG